LPSQECLGLGINGGGIYNLEILVSSPLCGLLFLMLIVIMNVVIMNIATADSQGLAV
jgi:hypothetical protein